MDTVTKLSGLTVGLHWLIALGILLLSGFGIYMAQTQSWPLYHIHKSIGLLIFVAILVRVVWRLKNGLPRPVRAFTRFEHLAAKGAHWLLLACTIAMPVTGMIYSGSSGNGFGIFSVEIFPANYPPAGGMAVPFNAEWSGIGQAWHGYVGYFLLGLIALHAAGALKHHLVDKDATLSRMLGRAVKQQ